MLIEYDSERVSVSPRWQTRRATFVQREDVEQRRAGLRGVSLNHRTRYSLGTLCLGGAIGRFNGPGEIQASSANGTIALGLDLTQLPQPSAFIAVQPGDTWCFQLWHRDVPQAGAPTNQMTGLVTLTFH